MNKKRYPELVQTYNVFRHVAKKAIDRLVMMMPFFDDGGIELILEMFRDTNAGEKILVCRNRENLVGMKVPETW